MEEARIRAMVAQMEQQRGVDITGENEVRQNTPSYTSLLYVVVVCTSD
jgi:hypothetical protein